MLSKVWSMTLGHKEHEAHQRCHLKQKNKALSCSPESILFYFLMSLAVKPMKKAWIGGGII